MKIRLMLLGIIAAAIFVAPAFAQITINQSDFVLTPGTTYTSSVNSDIDTNLWAGYTSGSGGGHLWDFSPITFTVSAQTKVVNANVVPLANQFSNPTAAWELLGGQSWTMFRSVPNQLYTLGNVSIGPYDLDPGIGPLKTYLLVLDYEDDTSLVFSLRHLQNR